MNAQSPDSHHNMENSRRGFLKKAGASLIAATAASAFIEAMQIEAMQNVAQAGQQTLITIPAANLPTTGNAVYFNFDGVLVNGTTNSTSYTLSRKPSGNLVALSRICTHQGCATMTIHNSGGMIYWLCPCHSAKFNQDGVVTQGPAGSPLPRYGTSLATNGDLTIDTNVSTLGLPTDDRMATTFSLSQNYPNPFNPTTLISFTLPKAARTTLKIYDITGRNVQTLFDEQTSAGTHQVTFNASNLAGGTYLYKLTSGNLTETKKMTLVK
jgi:Rieske Fe-S protein